MNPRSDRSPTYQEPMEQPRPDDAEATHRLRLALAVSILAEVILPAIEASLFPRPDWLAIEIQGIWFGLTLALWTATWHPLFSSVWRPLVLLFCTGLILSAGILSLKGASLAPFMFLLVLLPVGGTILPWNQKWQAAMSSLCLLFGMAFSIRLDWQNHLVISGLSAMIASILGSHLVSASLASQREHINNYVQALTRSEEKFRKIFETSGSLIAIHAIPDGRIIDVNAAWERTFGYSRTEVLGKLPDYLEFTPNTESFAQRINQLKIGDSGEQQMPVVFRGRHGKTVHCVYSWTTLELGGRYCVLIVGQDVTARVEAEEALRLNREALVNQEPLKAVGELASGIAHDLNNSLNALRLRVELLGSDPALLARHHDALQLIARIVRDAAATIGRFQNFARHGHGGQIETVDLRAIIAQSVQIAKSTLEERNVLLGRAIRIDSQVPPLPLTMGDPAELRQVFLNLLLNAQDAMTAGGIIRITGNREKDEIVIKVEDEGQGIPEENLARIFAPFFTTKGKHGTGLGLAIASSSVARVGGRITAANRSQGGAVFTLSFPLALVKPHLDAQILMSKIVPRHVMLIDDDLDNLNALGALLEWQGHTVIRARSSREALEKLSDSPVDVVFCDLGMPEIDGWEVARRVKARNVAPTFYLLTGWAAEIQSDDPRQKLVDAVVAKPVDPAVLNQLLARQPTEQCGTVLS